MNDLVLCTSCSRHLRRNEERCPFCGSHLSDETRRARPPVAPAGLSRAKLYAFHVAVATGVAAGVATAACGGATVTPGDAGGSVDARSNDATGGDGQATGDAAEGQDSASDSPFIFESGTDGTIVDAGADRDGWGPPPPPYGCVFPEGCGDVKV
jgi:hypothetical protein